MHQVITATAFFLFLLPGLSLGQSPFKAPKTFPPDAETLRQIMAKTEQLRAAIRELPKDTPEDITADVEVYAKAAEWIVRHEEYLQKDIGKHTLAVLDAGLKRAASARDGKTPWRDVRGKPIVRGYVSHVDGSVQPFSVTLPSGYPGGKLWRMDVVLHGRDQTLTEVKFIHTREVAKAGGFADRILLEVYGRGNNAYRWAGETDVIAAQAAFYRGGGFDRSTGQLDPRRIVIRGFSMGGAGAWHFGLHHPYSFAAIQPGAGFTTTHGYIKNLPARLPDYQEKCLRIYDAIAYAENVSSVPVVAYSGEKDAQKAAADQIENALKSFRQPLRFTHIVAPGLEHRQPAEWFAKCDAKIAEYLPRADSDNVRLVTYTPKYGEADWCNILALERQYEKAVVEGKWDQKGPRLTTSNVQAILVSRFTGAGRFGSFEGQRDAKLLVIDGSSFEWPSNTAHGKGDRELQVVLEKNLGKWSINTDHNYWQKSRSRKRARSHGPIDDAFMDSFVVSPPSKAGWHPKVVDHANASLARFEAEWDKYFRGRLPRTATKADIKTFPPESLILFGDPGSNPDIARVIEKLPITWTREKLVVNGVEYDPRSHVPVLIYPHPLNSLGYVVINSGHTFRAADLRGTNALLYPRLGDWAVLKVAPTKDDPAAAEVVAAGLFDENWQFVNADEQKSFLAPGSKLEKLWGDGEFTEGPAPGPDGAIYFSDIGNRIMRFEPKTGKMTVFRDPSGRSNGLKFDAKGRLVACEGANIGGNRRISVTEADGTVKTLAERYMGKRFNSPNDLTIDAKGRIYFTDPRYVGDEPRELDHESVYRVDPDGSVTRVIADVTKPNGIVLSPDEKTLFLSEHHPTGDRQLLAYPLSPDGTVGAKRVLHDFGRDRGIDGMTVSNSGLIVATAGSKVTAGIHFFDLEGKKVGFLPTPEDPNNCCFAGPGSRTLYITAGKSLYRVELTVAGK
jgi:sugar lactone lactonase YvrE